MELTLSISFIHTLMYLFYTCSALKLPFPTFLKKSLTKLQITQFLVGGASESLSSKVQH